MKLLLIARASRFTPLLWLFLCGGLVAWALGRWIGGVEAVVLVVGVTLVALTAIMQDAWVRRLGPVLVALLALTLTRPVFSLLPSLLLAGSAGLLSLKIGRLSVMRRVTFMVPSLVLLIFVTTLLMYHAPGNPFAQERAQDPQVEAALRAQYGVPESAVDFFWIYMKRLVLDGSFGPSLKVQGRSVEELLAPAFPVSVSLGLLALVIASTLGLALGIRAGLKPGQWSDHSSMALAMVGLSLPNFVIGALLMIVFSLKLGLLPIAGWGGYGHLFMPAITLALPYAAYIARLARSGTIETMQQDFIRTARAKGLPERVVVLKHALKGALLPVVSFLGPAAAGIMTGSFVVETLFAIPGMGQWFVKGAINRDYSVVLATAVIYTALVTVFNLLVDLAYAWLEPRARSSM
jgi:oligopeptide transport system permease protein